MASVASRWPVIPAILAVTYAVTALALWFALSPFTPVWCAAFMAAALSISVCGMVYENLQTAFLPRPQPSESDA